jgi:hypothetical protein
MNNNTDIDLKNENLWKWLALGRDSKIGSHIDDYLELIAKYQAHDGYIVKLMKHNQQDAGDTMKNLSQFMPRKYFLEIQYCAETFARVFGQVFPPLLPHVEQLAYIEWLLYTEPGYKKYRDHLVHMFKVAFVGDCFLNDKKFIRELTYKQFKPGHFRDWCKYKRFNISALRIKEKKEIMKMAFFLAAIFHDFGYGYFYHNLYAGRLFKLNDWLPSGADFTNINTPFFKKIEKSLPFFYVKQKHNWYKEFGHAGKQQEKLLISGFFRDCLPLNHSIASMFTILDIAEKFREVCALNDELYIAFQIAAEAIMLHDMTGKKNWLHLAPGKNDHFLNSESYKESPLAVLLIYADELSVWERYRLKTKPNKNINELIYYLDINNVIEDIKINIDHKSKTVELIISPNERVEEFKNDLKKNLGFFKQKPSDDNESFDFCGYQISVLSDESA